VSSTCLPARFCARRSRLSTIGRPAAAFVDLIQLDHVAVRVAQEQLLGFIIEKRMFSKCASGRLVLGSLSLVSMSMRDKPLLSKA